MKVLLVLTVFMTGSAADLSFRDEMPTLPACLEAAAKFLAEPIPADADGLGAGCVVIRDGQQASLR